MIKKIKNILSKPLQNLDEHTLEVVKKSSSSLIVKVAGMVAGFLLSVFLGRTLGADGLGVINLSNSLITTIFMLLNILLNVILINLFGVLGAAIAMALTIAGVNITRIIVAKKNTGILTLGLKN